MRQLKWLGLIAAATLVIICFIPWVTIESKGLVLTGINTEGTNFGKPAYLHFVFTLLFVPFALIRKIWAKRANLLVGAINLAWALRNFFEIGACRGGECPEKELGIYLLLISSGIMLAATLFPDMPASEKMQ